ncbi:hypothetical protein LQ757_12355 [Agromyces sp. SYSU K20354]|uniref:hypothetical protein n=1 Tax=Agromyces cavernae TaxID=2898659 RepID=UPI001E33FBE5|nr:hypothetical protein [Agromyces cavernae]MCD2443066.1 hypothetical protein [Agromyces cavernae]
MRARARTSRLAAIGAMIGLALAATTAVAPASASASAAKPQPSGQTATATSTYTCAHFNGLTVTADTVNRSSVSLKAGEVIGATVSPARVGDEIFLSVTSGLNFVFYSAPATSGLKYTAPYGGTFNLGWSLKTSGTRPSSLTWTFTCSTGGTTTTTDTDRDGVANSADSCAGTILPDSVSRKVAGKYYALSSGRFVDGTGKASGHTVIDAGGCSASQIASALGLSKRESQSGISLTVLTNWAASH